MGMNQQRSPMPMNLPHPDAVTGEQINTLLRVISCMEGYLLSPHRDVERIPGDTNPDGGVADSAAATVINACNALDNLISDKTRWSMEFQKKIESRVDEIHQEQLAFLKAQTAAANFVSLPQFRFRPTLNRADEHTWVAYIGELETPHVILGLGKTPEEALASFDQIFRGTVSPSMLEWALAREKAINEGSPLPEIPYEKTVDRKRTERTAKTSARGQKRKGNS
jgi:predicted RNase H-like HicB family nuclease